MGCASSTKSIPVIEGANGNTPKLTPNMNNEGNGFFKNAQAMSDSSVNSFTSKITDKIDDLQNEAKDVADSAIHKIQETTSGAVDAVESMFEKAEDKVESFFGKSDKEENNEKKDDELDFPPPPSMDKPPTPYPEAALNNIQWTPDSPASSAKEANSTVDDSERKETPLESIREIRNEDNFISPTGVEGPLVVEILTIEISEIPLEGDEANQGEEKVNIQEFDENEEKDNIEENETGTKEIIHEIIYPTPDEEETQGTDKENEEKKDEEEEKNNEEK